MQSKLMQLRFQARTSALSQACAIVLIASVASSCTDNDISSCADNEADVYTLYRNSNIANGETMRIHVATFDTEEGGEDYNAGSCAFVARALQQRRAQFINEPSDMRWWCERGRFRD